MPLITADQRLARQRGATVALVAAPGTGKTFQARFLRGQEGCVFIDMEAGTLAIDRRITTPDGAVLEPFGGNVIEGVRSWEYAQALATIIGGVDPNRKPGESYSREAYEKAVYTYGPEAEAIQSSHTIFLDSLTYLSRACYEWATQQPQAWTAKGAFDQWGAYRLLADEMVRLIKHVQQAVTKRIVFAMILDRSKDGTFEYQLHGQATAKELYGVFDTVVALVEVVSSPQGVFLADGAPPEMPRHRAFVCNKPNPWGLPVKDRSSRLSMLEPADLGAVLDKMTAR